VNIQLNYEQSSRLELLALHAGKPAAELLTEAALFLLTCDSGTPEVPSPSNSQTFLPEDELAARFARILRH
jgi:hypothetical protein